MSDLIDSYDPNAALPKPGTRWVWEIDSPHARTLIEVTDARWNGEEWWVFARKLRVDVSFAERHPQDYTDETYPNDLGRFWEAATPVGGRAEDFTEHRPSDALPSPGLSDHHATPGEPGKGGTA